jgi:CRP-like cAMP-binding protein
MERVLDPRAQLFREGDQRWALYQVIEGLLIGYRVFADGHRQVVFFAVPGDVVGFGHGAAHQLDCEAIVDSRVRAIPMAAMAAAVRHCPGLRERLLDVVTRQLAGMQEHSMLMGRKTAGEKIAGFLVELSQRMGQRADGPVELSLPMKRHDIADFLGVTVETVSRTVTKLKMMGIADVPRLGVLTILDMQRLQGLADGDELL